MSKYQDPNVLRMVRYGYCVSPNNIWSQPGVGMYPASRGLLEYPDHVMAEVHVGDFGVRVFKSTWNDGQFLGLKTLAEYDSADAFIQWLEVNGKVINRGEYNGPWD